MKKILIIAIFTIGLVSILSYLKVDTLSLIRNPKAATPVSFSFSFSADYGRNARAQSVFAKIPELGNKFHISLGDLSYGDVSSANDWCNMAKSAAGSTFPIMLISGNHEDYDAGNGSDNFPIDAFSECLPNRLTNPDGSSAIVGTYAKEYYFDYPSQSPIARFILISPGITPTKNSPRYNYTNGSDRYLWVASAIDSARSKNIPWVVVGMHKNCLSVGEKTSCEVGSDLMNLLIQKKVDLVINGHDHNYQRSKQLTCATPGSYNSSCVADDGADGFYTKGKGTVFVINGVGGKSFYAVSSSDREAGYFATSMGSNSPNRAYGISNVNVSSTELKIDFIPTASDNGVGGTYSDSFKISQSSTNPTATPTTILPSVRPSATPTITTPSVRPTVPTTPTPIPTKSINTPTPTLSQSQNLLPNPSFSSDPRKDSLYFTHTNPASPQVVFSWASTGYAGRSVSISAPNVSSSTLSRWLSQHNSSRNIPVTPGSTYSAEAYLKTDSAQTGATIAMVFWGPGLLDSPQTFSSSKVTGTTNWTKRTVQATAPSSAKYVRFEMRLIGSGNAWFDEVKLIKN